MRLTQDHKHTFVRAVMADVPKTDYKTQIAKRLYPTIEGRIPKIVMQAYKKHPEFFQKLHVYIGAPMKCYVYLDLPKYDHYSTVDLTEKEQALIADLIQAAIEQDDRLDSLKSSLNSSIRYCKTLKQLKEALPEFEKYMPEENQPASQNLPALANIVADFKAAGLQFKTEQAA